MSALLVSLILPLVVSASGLAAGDSCRADPERLAALRADVERVSAEEAAWSRRWGYTWGGLATVQLVAAQLVREQDGDDRRVDFYVGALGSTAGLVASRIVGPRILWPEPRAAEVEAGACAEQARLQRALERAGEDEALMHGWVGHVGGKLFTLGMAAILGFGYKHWRQAALTTGAGFLLGEWMIATRPRAALDALERRQGSAPRGLDVKLSLALEHDAAGLMLGINF